MLRKTLPVHYPRSTMTRFNEAAAQCCGKRLRRNGMQWRRLCFNEAAAQCCGKHAGQLVLVVEYLELQ